MLFVFVYTDLNNVKVIFFTTDLYPQTSLFDNNSFGSFLPLSVYTDLNNIKVIFLPLIFIFVQHLSLTSLEHSSSLSQTKANNRLNNLTSE